MTVDKQEVLLRGADVLGDLVMELRAELAASQAREQAAIADMKICAEDVYCSVCGANCDGGMCVGFEWRGPQQAEEAASPIEETGLLAAKRAEYTADLERAIEREAHRDHQKP